MMIAMVAFTALCRHHDDRNDPDLPFPESQRHHYLGKGEEGVKLGRAEHFRVVCRVHLFCSTAFLHWKTLKPSKYKKTMQLQMQLQ
jgi:hypothetical protein